MTTRKPTPTPTRARALVHMHRMLATSAAALAVGDTACHRGDRNAPETSDAAFGPPAVEDASMTVPPVGTFPVNDAPEDGGTTTKLVVQPRDHGYAVVDPMPRPAYCPAVHKLIKGTAKRVGADVVVTLGNAGGKNKFRYTGQAPSLYSGTLVKHTVDARGSAVVTVQPGPSDVSFSVRATCDDGALVSVNATVNVSSLTVVVNVY